MVARSIYLTVSVIGHSPSSGLPRRGLVTKDGTTITEGCKILNLDDFPLGSIFGLSLLVSGHDLPPQPPPTPEAAAEALAALASLDADVDNVRRAAESAASEAADSAERALLDRVLSGTSLAETFRERFSALLRVIETLSRHLPPEMGWRPVLTVLSASIEAMSRGSGNTAYWEAEAREMWTAARRDSESGARKVISKAIAADLTSEQETLLLRRVLSGAPLTPNKGARDVTLSQVVASLSRHLPADASWQAVLAVLSTSIETMPCMPEGADHWKNEARRKWERARQAPAAAKQAPPATDRAQGLAEVVAALQHAGARLTGSRARGEERPDSDFDFYVPKRAWAKFVREAPTGWTSVITGHVGWRIGHQLIDVSKLFRRQGDRVVAAQRDALGATWNTY